MKRDRGKQIDAKATASVEAFGWTVSKVGPRHVARKRVIHEDHSETFMFESTYTLEGLAKIVKRREREEATNRRPK